MRKEEALRNKFNNKFNRKHKSFGSGRKAAFPRTESRVAALVRERRSAHRVVSKSLIIEKLREEAKAENPTLFSRLKVDDDVFFGFIWRHGFSFRKPSNTKSLAKSEAVKRLRGFWLWIIRLLSGSIPIYIGDLNVTDDARYGRFPLDCRWNKDEVPGTFGDIARLISLRNEKATVLRTVGGWGDRICTLIINIGPTGLQLPVGVVFKGSGQKLKDEEVSYYKTLTNIFVCFQEKAWVDTRIEIKLINGIIKPAVARLKDSYESRGKSFPGVLLIEDNFKPHFSEYSYFCKILVSPGFLNFCFRPAVKALQSLQVFPIALPALVTDIGQTVDDTNGKTFKHDMNELFNRYLESFDWEASPKGSITASKKRMVTSEIIDQVAGAYNTKHSRIIHGSCMRTGLKLTIDGSDLESMVPAKYVQKFNSFVYHSILLNFQTFT
jgi:hypothetical protein